jgi:serine/threonine-protein kinase
MQAVVDDPVPSARSVRPEIPEALDRIIQRALAKQPQDRFQSAGDMQQALEDWSARNGGTIPDVRVSLTTSSYFSPAEKAPLPTQAKEQLTGTFAALTGAPPTTGAGIQMPPVAPPQPLWTPKRAPTIVERLQNMTPAMAFGLTVSLGVFVLGILALLILALR